MAIIIVLGIIGSMGNSGNDKKETKAQTQEAAKLKPQLSQFPKMTQQPMQKRISQQNISPLSKKPNRIVTQCTCLKPVYIIN